MTRIIEVNTFATIPSFVPFGVLYFTQDTSDLYIGTGSSTGPAVNFVSGGGTGSVSSITFTGDGTVLSNTPSAPVTTTGTVAATLKNQAANRFLAGPASGANAAPTFRALASADAPTPQQGINASQYGVTGNGYFKFDAVGYFFALSQAAIAGSVVTYTGTLAVASTGIAQTISNIVETAGNVVTLTVAAGSYIASQKVNLSGLTTGTWLNGQTVTLLTGTTQTTLIFNDPTAHGVQASHAETGTALVNLNGYSFSIAGFVNAGNNGTFTITSNTATTLVVTNASGVNETHAGTAGSFTVDCSTANFTTNATVGQLAFATNLPPGGFNKASTVVIPQGTISAIVSATQVNLSQAANATTATTSGTICLVWGDDQSTALTNAWNAVTACPNGQTLILPGINPLGNGPAVMLTQKAQFNFQGLNPGGGASRTGYGLCGGGKNVSYIVPTPNFDFNSTVNNVCFLNVVTGGYFHDFTIWGAGNSNPAAGLGSKIIAQIQSADNAAMHHVSLIGWGANVANGIGIGLNIAGGEVIIDEIELDMFGQTGCQCTNSGGDGYVYFGGCGFWDNGVCNLHIAGNALSPVYTHGCNFGGASYGVSVTGSGIWNDTGSIIGLNVGSVGAFIPVTLGDFNGTLGSTGTAFLTGTTIDVSTGFASLYVDNTNCSITLVGCRVKDRGTQICISNNGTVIDGGGNSFFTAGTYYSGTGTFLRSSSEMGRADLTGQIAAIATTTLYTPQITGLFRISAYLKITTAGTSPVLGPVTITYTDGTDSVAQSVVMQLATEAGASATTTSGNTTTSVLNGTTVINAKTAVAIRYAVALTGTVGTGAYEVHMKCESI